jgi:hypothetical protein
MSNEVEVEEKDNLWLIAGIIVACLIGALLMVKSAEHDKYTAAQKAISEDSSNSAYRADAIHSKDGLNKK